jgi:hypothetical protein
MAKIYPDTNRFIDFYQAALDSIDIFDQLNAFKADIVLTEQTITEFRRNRVSTLRWLAKEFHKSITIGSPYTTTVLRSLPGHKELTGLFSAYKEKGKETLHYLNELIEDEAKDPIAQKFLALSGDQAVRKIAINDGAITLAHRRKLLGNAPSSPDRHTIGDELIWELLCQELKEDLIIVTKDKTFFDNISLLSQEYRKRTGHTLLLVTENFSEALKRIGQVPPPQLVTAEEEAKKQSHHVSQGRVFTSAKIKAMLNREICPVCGSEGRIWGFDGADGDAFDCFECHSCGLMFDLAEHV